MSTGYFIFVTMLEKPTPDQFELLGWLAMAGHIRLRLSESLNPIFYNISSRLANAVLLEWSLVLAWFTATENFQGWQTFKTKTVYPEPYVYVSDFHFIYVVLRTVMTLWLETSNFSKQQILRTSVKSGWMNYLRI